MGDVVSALSLGIITIEIIGVIYFILLTQGSILQELRSINKKLGDKN
jgi:hypothetical protein